MWLFCVKMHKNYYGDIDSALGNIFQNIKLSKIQQTPLPPFIWTVEYIIHPSGVATQQLANLVEKAARDDKLVVTLGGDHTLATGSLIGHLRARPNLCVLYIDAMNDNNSHRTSPTGSTTDLNKS